MAGSKPCLVGVWPGKGLAGRRAQQVVSNTIGGQGEDSEVVGGGHIEGGLQATRAGGQWDLIQPVWTFKTVCVSY